MNLRRWTSLLAITALAGVLGYLAFRWPIDQYIGDRLPGPASRTPGLCNAAPCAPGEIRYCQTKCVRPAAEGEICAPYPSCDGPPCDVGLACTRVRSGLPILDTLLGRARCRPALDYGSRCVDTALACPSGQFCQEFILPVSIHAGPSGPGIGPATRTAGLCQNWLAEGESCARPKGDLPCEPGLSCVEGFCRRPCAKNEDCPCKAGSQFCCNDVCQSGFETTWAAIQRVVFQGGGCVGCHNPAYGDPDQLPAKYDLASDPYASTLGTAGSSLRVPPLRRVEPNEPDLSVLYIKLLAATRGTPLPNDVSGSPMPPGCNPQASDPAQGGCIPEAALEALARWIRFGAPKEGVVEGTEKLFATCLPCPTPQKVARLAEPACGVQLFAPPWKLPGASKKRCHDPGCGENEICYATYYDVTRQGTLSTSADAPCPADLGGPSARCFRYQASDFAQDPHSHHSITRLYVGAPGFCRGGANDDSPCDPARAGEPAPAGADCGASSTCDPIWKHPQWAPWTCKGGARDGMACDPTGIGKAAPAGADCGAGGGCTSAVQPSGGCLGYGPPGFHLAMSPILNASQEPHFEQPAADGVYNVIPMQGYAVWNSHAFNCTTVDTTIEQYLNLECADAAHQTHRVRMFQTSVAEGLFVPEVAPYERAEYCATKTFDVGSHVFALTSHMHKRGKRFRIWAPPNPSCPSTTGCRPRTDAPIYTSTDYTDPFYLQLEPAVPLTSSLADERTYKYCAEYDNGSANPASVKRASTSPQPPVPGLPGGPCSPPNLYCAEVASPPIQCSSPSACQSGACDACYLKGGFTTEDEMFMMIALYYEAP